MDYKNDEQIKAFFKHNPVDDSEYLKHYIATHPDNKMAWYLLGREYAARGEHAKARYCFVQAGEIYEAFEENPMEARKSQTGEDRAPDKKPAMLASSLRSAVVMLIGALLLLLLPADANRIAHHWPEGDLAGTDVRDEVVAETVQDNPQFIPSPADSKAPAVFYFTDKLAANDRMADLLHEMLFPGQYVYPYSVLAQAQFSEDGKWINWIKEPNLLLSVGRQAASGRTDIRYHDANSCVCEPEPADQARQMMQLWQQQQEQQLVMMSAIHAFRQKQGAMPEKLEQIVSPYPNNQLSGYTPYMSDWFRASTAGAAAPSATILTVTVGEERPANVVGTGNPGTATGSAGTGSGALSQAFTEPLRIVVDKTAHRLAVVSGNVILRNYPVGLGGSRTPEGEFEISEKVKNPNGRSDGEFGSRGMTLSDTLYAIHGTNEPKSIGLDQSLGCIRMLKADVEELFDMVPKGTKVTIGNGLLPSEIMRASSNFKLPAMVEETNPNKRYRWLN